MLHRSILALSNFLNDQAAKVAFIEADKEYHTFKVLADCLDITTVTHGPIRMAAAGITARLIKH